VGRRIMAGPRRIRHSSWGGTRPPHVVCRTPSASTQPYFGGAPEWVERKSLSVVAYSHGSPPVLSLCLYTQAVLLSPRPKARRLLHPVRTRAAPSSRTPPVCKAAPTGTPASPPRAHTRGTVVPKASVSRAVPVHSLWSGRNGVPVPPRAATSTREAGVCPPPITEGALATA